MITTFYSDQIRSLLFRLNKSKHEKKAFQLHNHVEEEIKLYVP